MKLGKEPKGLVGSGYVRKAPLEYLHWNPTRARARDKALYVEVEFDCLAEEPLITLVELESLPFSSMNWTPQASGIRIPAAIGDAVDRLWARRAGIGALRGPDEFLGAQDLVEGAVRTTTVNGFERNAEARRRCLAHYGARCFACDFSFGETYGDFADNYIHVHHIVPLATIKKGYVVDPVTDLRPLCPNCHAAIHLREPLLSPEELRATVRRRTRA